MKTSQLGLMTARQEINLDIFIACQENKKNQKSVYGEEYCVLFYACMQWTNLVDTHFIPAKDCNAYKTTAQFSLFLGEPKEEQIFLEGFDHVFKHLKLEPKITVTFCSWIVVSAQYY